MSETGWLELTGIAATVLLFLIGLYLAAKDLAQQRLIDAHKEQIEMLQSHINDLYVKHETDATKLASLEVELAKNYNPKHEITGLFDTFRLYLNERFDRLEQAIGVERRKQ